MDRRVQLAAWATIAVLAAAIAVVAVYFEPFRSDPGNWPLRVRYEVQQWSDLEADPRLAVGEFGGRGWDDWVALNLPVRDTGEADVVRFDGDLASGTLGAVDAEPPFAAFDMLGATGWQEVTETNATERTPMRLFAPGFGSYPDRAIDRAILTDDDIEARRHVADRLGLPVEAVGYGRFQLALCEAGTVNECGNEIAEYRYVFHREAAIPLYLDVLEEAGNRRQRMTVTAADFGWDGPLPTAG